MFGDTQSLTLTIGALIGLIILSGVIACCYAIPMTRRRRAAKAEASAAKPAVQSQPSSGSAGSAIIQTAEPGKNKPAKTPQPPKAAKVKPFREQKKGGGLFSFSRRKKEKPIPPAASTLAGQDHRPAPAAEKPCSAEKAKEQKALKVKVVKETGVEKERKFGLFGKNKDNKKDKGKKTERTAEKSCSPPPQVTAAAPVSATEQAAVVTQSPEASYAAQPEAVQAAQPPEGIAPASQEPAPPPVEENKEKENGASDSVFNLFTDMDGEESEISQFAANFDNVTLDALLHDCQIVINRLSKN